MSEYQFYEFQTIDRPLSKKEMQEIARLSSRVELKGKGTVRWNVGKLYELLYNRYMRRERITYREALVHTTTL